MRVLDQPADGLRFLAWTLWLSMPLSVLAFPGVMEAWHSNRINPDDWCMIGVIAAIISLLSAFIILAILALLTGGIGLAICRARQEPAWPIAAAAGGYLAGLVPWVAAAQALWLWPIFYDNRHYVLWQTCQGFQQTLRIPAELIFGALLLAPAFVGLLLAIRTAVVCYRNVRYACR